MTQSPDVKHLYGRPGDPISIGTVETKALRYNTGKFLMSLVPSSLVRYTAAVLTYGKIKYDAHNWRKGFPWSSILDSMDRHVQAFKDGEDYDEESGLPHLAHIACNAAFLIEHFDQGLGVDDRYKLKNPPKKLAFNAPPAKPPAE